MIMSCDPTPIENKMEGEEEEKKKMMMMMKASALLTPD